MQAKQPNVHEIIAAMQAAFPSHNFFPAPERGFCGFRWERKDGRGPTFAEARKMSKKVDRLLHQLVG